MMLLQGSLQNRISSQRGITRMSLILIIIASILAVVVLGVPLYHYFVDRSDAYGCGAALATANDQLKIYYLAHNSNPTAEEAKTVVTQAMDGWDDLCPGGGDCHIVTTDEEGVPFKVVCALHDDDPAEAALLNAKTALSQVVANPTETAAGSAFTVTVNSNPIAVTSDPTETVTRPTRKELKSAGGALITYHCSTVDGSVIWFCYVDENRICIWDSDQSTAEGYTYGWTVRNT